MFERLHHVSAKNSFSLHERRLCYFAETEPQAPEPNMDKESSNSLREFAKIMPPAIVDTVEKAVKFLGPNKLPAIQVETLTNQNMWIDSFQYPPLLDNATKLPNFYSDKATVAERNPRFLLQTLDLETRKNLFKQFVDSYVPAAVQAQHEDIFGPANQKPELKIQTFVKNRDKILDAMKAMIGGDLPAQDPGHTVEDIAFDSLQNRYKAGTGFDSSLLRKEAETARKNPTTPSFFTGAKKLGALTPDALAALGADLQTTQEKHERNTSEARDNLTKLDTKIKINEATDILDKMEGWEKLVLIGLVGYMLVKHTKVAAVAFLTYLGVKYVGGVKDPLGAGLGKVKEGVDYLKGKNRDTQALLGMSHDKDPAEVADNMARFAEGMDIHNITEQTEVMATLNGKTISELSKAFQMNAKGWNLDLAMLYGGREKIPPYFKQKDHQAVIAQSVGYILFSHYRSRHPGDAEVKIVNDRMASLALGKTWLQEIKEDPQLARTYENLVLRGKREGLGDSMQLHTFVEQQVTQYQAKPKNGVPPAPGTTPNIGQVPSQPGNSPSLGTTPAQPSRNPGRGTPPPAVGGMNGFVPQTPSGGIQ